MNALPELQPILASLTERFGAQIQPMQIPRPNEVYFQGKMELVPGFCALLYKEWGARLASLFADDVRAQTGDFHLYYVFALDAAHGFLILRVPVPPSQPRFVSLTNALPALNCQEREIQDLFGLKLEGHPNARPCALHDDWPAVHPLRKDFALRTVLPPFAGERHKFRVVEGEASSGSSRPGMLGIIEPGHFLFSVAGESVLYLQIRSSTPTGHGEAFETCRQRGVALAESISGDSPLRTRRPFVTPSSGRREWRRRPERAPCAASAWNWSAFTTISAILAPSRPMWPSSSPTLTPCGSRSRSCA